MAAYLPPPSTTNDKINEILGCGVQRMQSSGGELER